MEIITTYPVDIKSKLIESRRRKLVDAKAIQKIGHKRWYIISKESGINAEIFTALFDAGKKLDLNSNESSSTSEVFINQSYLGEDVYLQIRPELISSGIVMDINAPTQNESFTSSNKNRSSKPKKVANVSKSLKVSKADKIKQDNLMKKVKTDLSNITNPASSSYNTKFIELILVRLMIQCNKLTSKLTTSHKQLKSFTSSKYQDDEEIQKLHKCIETTKNELIELVVGLNKIYVEKKKNPSISTTCLFDFQTWIDFTKKSINFNVIDTIIKRPELIFKTPYDFLLENKQITLYPSQKEILQFVTTNDSFLARVHTMLGAGKTSMVLPLCGWLMHNKKNIKTKIIFCCPNEIVLLEVAHMIFGMGVPFAIVTYTEVEKVGKQPESYSKKYGQGHMPNVKKVSTSILNAIEYEAPKKVYSLKYNWASCIDKDPDAKEKCVLYLCDIFVARLLLEERVNCVKELNLLLEAHRRDPKNYPLTEKRLPQVPDYLFIGDELTKDADSQNGFLVDSGFSLTTELFVDLMKIAPPKIILMSATLPTEDQLPDFYQRIIDANPGMIARSFSSSEAKIGCALVSLSGELYAPHMECKTVNEIRNVLSTIKSNPFIGRFYTFEVLLEMVNSFKQLSLTYPDLTQLFDDPSKANQSNIQQIAYTMLQELINKCCDKTVEKSCMMKKCVGKGVNINTMLTSDIYRFNKGCIVFSSDPVATAIQVYQSNFDNYLGKTDTERNIFKQIRLDIILNKYEKEMDSYNKMKTRIEEKLDDGISKRNKINDKKEQSKLESWKIISHANENKPTWDFPKELQLCTVEHLNKVKCSTRPSLAGFVGPEDIPKDSSVSLEILTMLASGIGVYSTSSPALDDEYLNTVLTLAKKGLLKVIFSDSSIAYGTNLAVADIVIIDEPVKSRNNIIIESIVDMHSMKTIFQMLGRAGRGGNLSYEARIYTTSRDNHLINKIKSYIRGTLNEGIHDEIQNIHRAFEILW